MAEYSFGVERTQAYYILEKKKNNNGGGQASYNLTLDFEEELKNKGVIGPIPNFVNNSASAKHIGYELINGYKLKLGNNIIALIGEQYKKIENKVAFIHTVAKDGTTKFQIFKTYQKEYAKTDNGYKWFLDLYAENIEGSDFIVNINEDKKIMTMNVRLKQSTFRIENHEDELIVNEPQEEDMNKDITNEQIILYGVPGCGKSFSIDRKLKEDLKIQKNDKAKYTQRVVFHQEYTNADFIGQILPKSDGTNISYPFIPGPFTQILRKAYRDKNHNYALIIEEINRGNAAAIFGELFQLLDRFKPGDETETLNEVTYDKGWSSYCVNNDAIIDYIINNPLQENEGTDDPFISQEIMNKYKTNIAIRLPPNLSLFATMNTSDQNVFKLDNAFKRRWLLELIPNEFRNTDAENVQKDADVEGFPFKWGAFRETVNNIIKDPKNGFDSASFSDKQLGTWFVKHNSKNEISKTDFAYKVIEYLWDDVFTDEFTIFNKDAYPTLADVVNAVINDGKTDIFTINIKSDDKQENVQ